MPYFIIIGLSFLLLGGFLLLTAFEGRKGFRALGGVRGRLDRTMSRATFIAQHVDWRAFARELAATVFERVVHDVAHTSLRIVRTIERALTRVVRFLRERRGLPLEDGQERSPLARGAEKVRAALRRSRRTPERPTDG